MRNFKLRDCEDCGAEFQPRGSKSSCCDDCLRKRELARYKRGRRAKTLAKYKMTVEQYDKMLADQGGVCKICGKEDDAGKALAVDHDHRCCPTENTCGKCVRGLLCSRCNTALGIVESNLAGFKDYMARFYDKSDEEGYPF